MLRSESSEAAKVRRALGFAVLGGVLLGLAIVAVLALAPGLTGPRARCEGSVQGAASRVFLWNAERGATVQSRPGADGRYTLDVPAADVPGSRIVAESAEGAATSSGPLEPPAAGGPGPLVVPPLRLWGTRVEIVQRGSQIRFAWPPLDEPGIDRLRYSLTFTFSARHGGAAAPEDSTLLTKDPEAIQTVEELVGLLPERDPAARTVIVRVRAFDSAHADGPSWTSAPTSWTFDPDVPAKGR